jgi:hypothetical protein
MGWRSAPSRTYTGPLLADARRVAFLWSPVLRLPRSPLCRFATSALAAVAVARRCPAAAAARPALARRRHAAAARLAAVVAAVATPRLAPATVAVAVAAPVVARVAAGRSSLPLCRRRPPRYTSLAHRRRRPPSGAPLSYLLLSWNATGSHCSAPEAQGGGDRTGRGSVA